MSLMNNRQFISYLIQHDISLSIIAIFEEQSINDEDLPAIDRDDIEHLFKNEYGFTFADRKRLWKILRQFLSQNMNNDVLYVEQQDPTPEIYEISTDEQSISNTTRHYQPSSSLPNVLSSAAVYNYPDDEIEEVTYEENNSKNDINNFNFVTTSFSVPTQSSQHSLPETSNNFIFKFPVQLPLFSSKLTKALETHTIDYEWTTLVDELTQWISSIKGPIVLKRSEYQSIGQTLYKLYPIIGRDGFRPWSYLCKCLTESLRKERYKSSLSGIQITNK